MEYWRTEGDITMTEKKTAAAITLSLSLGISLEMLKHIYSLLVKESPDFLDQQNKLLEYGFASSAHKNKQWFWLKKNMGA